ncbi:glutathione S-transferase family protein [Xanthobacteraceae bacterium A53D]
MLIVHHLVGSQSERIVWLCEELAIPYELVRYQPEPSGFAPPAYKALHHAGTAPVINDGALALAESCAVIDYIVAKYGNGRLTLKPDHQDFARFLYWYHYTDGTLMPGFLAMMGGSTVEVPLRERVNRGMAALEAHFAAGHPWLAGDTFTVADIMLLFPLTVLRGHVALDLSACPDLKAYLRRVAARPAFLAARAKADPDPRPLQLD